MLKDEDLLYPQYDHRGRLEAHLASPELIRWLGDEASTRLAADGAWDPGVRAVGAVREHWEELVARRDALPAEAAAGDPT